MGATNANDMSDLPSGPPRLKRSGTRRQGDEYQDAQALSFLVSWLKQNDRYQWIKLEADASGFLDDILVLRQDGVLEIWQIKFSTSAYQPDDVWSWSDLLKQPKGEKGKAKESLLQKWFKTWWGYHSQETKVSPGLRSNRHGAPELALDIPAGGKVRWSDLSDDVRQNIVEQLGAESEARAFFEVFRFQLGEPSLRELAQGNLRSFEVLGGTRGGFEALERAVREWVNLKDNPPPEGQIYLDEIRRIAKLKAHPVDLHTFLAPPVFFEKYMRPGRLFHHRLPQVGRRVQLKELLGFVEGKNQVAILPGRGGSGKSKLVHSLYRRLRRVEPDLSVRLVAEHLPIKSGALEELPDNGCLIIVDDAHNAAGLEVILAAAQQNPALKILLLTRPHAIDYLAAQVRSAGFDGNDIVVSGLLPKLTYGHHRRLSRFVLGRDWEHYADRLASITRDSPLLAVLGGELLRTRQVAPSFLSRDNVFRQEVLSRFRDIQFGEIILQLDGRFTAEQCANALPLVAALTPFDLGNEALLDAAAQLIGMDKVKLGQLLGVLVKGGALIQGGRLVRIVPDVLSDFILQEACFAPEGLPTGWATQVYRATAEICLDVVLRNLAELDWRVRTTTLSGGQSPVPNKEPGRALLDLIWDDVEESFRGSTLAERKAWLTRLARIAPMQPHRLWPLVEIVLNSPAAEDKDNNSLELNPWLRPTTQEEVLAALAPVLRGIAHDERFTARCADLLWEIGRDDKGRPGYSNAAMDALRQLASFERGKPLNFNYIVLERCREWMRDPNIHGYNHSVLDVISPLLSHRMESAEPDGRWIRSGSLTLPDDPLRELRQGALELVELCAQSGARKVVLEALQTLRLSVTEMGLWHLRFEDPADWQAGEWEVMSALKIVGRIARTNPDPFVRLRIWEYLHLQAERGPRPEVQRGAQEILDAIPHSFETRMILLMTGNHGFEQYSTTWTDSNESPSDDLEIDQATRFLKDQKRHKRNEEFVRQATHEWIERYPNVRLGFDAVDELMGRIESSGWWKDLWTRSNPLMLQLAADHPSYARDWCEIALEKPDSRATGMCDDLLCELRRQDQTGALGLAQRFLAHGHPNLQVRVAGSYSWRGWPRDPLPEDWQIVRNLLDSQYPHVKHIATKIVSAIASTDMKRAVEFVLNTDVADDSELAESLFEIFGEYHRFGLSEISLDELACLLDKLEKVKSLHSHSLGYFLVHAGLRDPKAVAKLLLSRLQQKLKLDRGRWESPTSETQVLGGQLIENFDALPEHGFYDERFQEVVNHPDYVAALRLIRDAALIEANRSTGQYDDTLSKLFRQFSLNYGAVALDVLDEWVNSGDCEKLQTALQLLGDTYLGFYVNNVPFVSNYLRRAQDCGRAVFEEVQSAMLNSAEFGPPGVMAAHSGEVAYALIDLGLKAVERAQGEPLAQRFFQQLCEKGRARIESLSQRQAAEEIFLHSY